MGYQTILVAVENRVATVTLDRPEYGDALAREPYAGIANTMKDLGSRRDAGSIVIIGAGRYFFIEGSTKRFKALIDGKEHLDGDSVANAGNVSVAIHECPKSVAAVTSGVATGVGLNYALVCDFRVVTPSSKVIMAFVNMSSCGDTGSIYNLTRLIDPDKAELLTMTRGVCRGEDCVHMGLATFLVEEDRLQKTTYNLASKLAGKSSATHAGQKRLIKKYFYGGLADFAVDEGEEIAAAPRLLDFTKAVNALLEKRAPECSKQQVTVQDDQEDEPF